MARGILRNNRYVAVSRTSSNPYFTKAVQRDFECRVNVTRVCDATINRDTVADKRVETRGLVAATDPFLSLSVLLFPPSPIENSEILG